MSPKELIEQLQQLSNDATVQYYIKTSGPGVADNRLWVNSPILLPMPIMCKVCNGEGCYWCSGWGYVTKEESNN